MGLGGWPSRGTPDVIAYIFEKDPEIKTNCVLPVI